MNPETPLFSFEPTSADERWIDAALSEHARLGREGADEEMILRILSETVHRPAPATRAKSSVAGFPVVFRRPPLTMTALAAAAALVLLLAGLASLKTSNGPRQSEELRFIVQLSKPQPALQTLPDAPPKAAGDAHLVTLPPDGFHLPATSPDFPALPQSLEIVAEFGPTFAELPREVLRDESLRIAADVRETTATGQAFRGEVVVEHDRFRIEADQVEVAATGDSFRVDHASLLARRVRVLQPLAGCEAEAEFLRYDPLTGNLVLTGVARVSTDRGVLGHFKADDRLVISPTGFSVETSPSEIHASAPLLEP